MNRHASGRAAAPLGARRRLRGDRFGVPLPSLSGGKEVPWRATAHALPVSAFFANPTRGSALGFSAPAPRGCQSHEFSVTDGAEKTLVIVTGFGFEECRGEPGPGEMEIPRLSFLRPVRSSGCSHSSRYMIFAEWRGNK